MIKHTKFTFLSLLIAVLFSGCVTTHNLGGVPNEITVLPDTGKFISSSQGVAFVVQKTDRTEAKWTMDLDVFLFKGQVY